MEFLTEHNNFEIDGQLYSKDELLDIYRIQKQLLIEENIIASIEECENAWSRYSHDLQAGWLFLPDKDEEILKYIRSSDFFTDFKDYLTN